MKPRQFMAWVGALMLATTTVAAERSEPVIDTALENEIRQDIEVLHEFFVGWYNGTLPEIAYDTEFAARLAPTFTIVMPSGVELDHDSLSAAMRQSFGKNPGFRIEIRNVRLVHASEKVAIATYEEWQFHEQEGPDSASARISTVVFARGETLKWLHVHETWLPEEAVEAER